MSIFKLSMVWLRVRGDCFNPYSDRLSFAHVVRAIIVDIPIGPRHLDTFIYDGALSSQPADAAWAYAYQLFIMQSELTLIWPQFISLSVFIFIPFNYLLATKSALYFLPSPFYFSLTWIMLLKLVVIASYGKSTISHAPFLPRELHSEAHASLLITASLD